MKKMFIPVKYKLGIDEGQLLKEFKKLPRVISICYSVQFQDTAFRIKNLIKDCKINSIFQILGCSKIEFPKGTKGILLIGSGRFHAVSLAFESKIPVFLLENNKLSMIPKDEITKLEKRHRAAVLNFLSSDLVGVINSTKPGQDKIKRAFNLANRIKKKNLYFFLGNNINPNELENFNITSWINTACPRLDFDYPIINISEVEDIISNRVFRY